MINKFVKAITFGHFGNSSTSRKKRGLKEINDHFYVSEQDENAADRSRTLPLSRPSPVQDSQLEDGIDGPTLKRGSTKQAWLSKTQASTLSNGSREKWFPPELNRTISDGERGSISALGVYFVGGHVFDMFDDGGNAVTWCDHCLQSICGIIHARKCLRCNLTCHWECCPAVQVTCEQYFQQNLLDTVKASTISSSQVSLFYDAAVPSIYAPQDDTLDSYSTLLSSSSSASAAWPYFPPNHFSSYSTVYSVKSLQNGTDHVDHTTRSLSEGHFTMQLSAPSFVRLLPEMCSVHTQAVRSYQYKSEFNVSREAYKSDLENLSKTLKEASHTAVFTPYDLSSLDHRSLQKYGIQVRTLSHRFLSNHTQPNAFLAPGQEISELGLLLGNDVDGKVRWNLAELQRRIAIFLGNTHGLTVSLESKDCVNQGDLRRYRCTGTIRVYIILIRTVRLAPGSLSSQVANNATRPSSIFDLVTKSTESEERADNPIASDTQPVWLPRGISKLLHIDLSMTTQEVVAALLSIFQIKDNPKKFALYEHTIEGDKEVSVRKLRDHECPLLLVLTWASTTVEEFNSTLLIKRLVLQENDTNDIDWHAFTVPELRNFLTILDKEEQEYKNQIARKYQILRENIEAFKQKRLDEFALANTLLSTQPSLSTDNSNIS